MFSLSEAPIAQSGESQTLDRKVTDLITRYQVQSSPWAWCCVLEQGTSFPLLSTG